jgi:PAS domain S-box-containing protein
MLKQLDDEISRIDITDVVSIKVGGDLRWTGRAKFPGAPRPRSIVIFQLGDEVVAMSAFCPHEQANMAEGRFVAPYVIECPLHQNTYDLRTGVIKTFKVQLEGEHMHLLWRRAANEPVAPTFSQQTQVAARSDDERTRTLEHELASLRDAARVREAHVVETLRQMDGMLHEVEEKKRAVEASHGELQKLNEFVTRVTDAMGEVLIVIDPRGAVREVNSRFTSLLGFARDEVVGKDLSSLVGAAANDNDGASELRRALLSGQKEAELEARLLAKSGAGIEHLLRIAPLYGRGGKREGAVLVGTEIEGLKAAQRELHSAYGRVQNLLDNMRQGVFVVVPSGEIIEPVSRYSAEVFGGNVVGKNVFDVLYADIPRDGEVFGGLETAFLTTFGAEEFQWDLMADLLPHRVVRRRTDAADEVAILKVEYCPLRDAQGLMFQLMVVVEDVTKVESLEREKQTGERRTQILEELAKNRTEDLRGFFGAAYEQLRDARRALDTHGDAETRTLMYRQLHTLKGNARVLGLTLIAQATHEAENVASVLKGTESLRHGSLERSREAVLAVQRQVSEYGDVAERILSLPNDLEARAIAELHGATSALDAHYSALCADVGREEARAAHARLCESTRACRDAAEAIGCDAVRHAARNLEHALTIAASELPAPSAGVLHELRLAQQAVIEAAIAQRLAKPSAAGHSLATSSWTALYLDAYALTQAVLVEPRTTEQRLTVQRAAERARSAAGALQAEYVAALVSVVEDAPESAEGTASAAAALRALWRHLALHSTLESLALVRPEERRILADALSRINGTDQTLVSLLDAGGVRIGTLVGFIGALRRKGISARSAFGVLGTVFGSEAGQAARLFISTRELEDLPELLSRVDARTSARAFDTWLGELGTPLARLPAPPHLGFAYLQKLDVLGLVRAVRDLALGNFQRLFDRVHTLEVMAYHYTQVMQALGRFKESRSELELEQLERSITHLLDVPVVPSLYKYYGMVAEIATRLGKRVAIQVHGDVRAALPRDTLYVLHDALVHLIRNAVDHGLEPSPERTGQGKPAQGIIDVGCRDTGSALVLELRDDGRGIDPAKIIKKARELGLIDENRAAQLSPREAVELVFLPHFSTAGSVTDISGRGIGMDAVRDSLAKIGATLSIDSQVGRGTTFTITIARSARQLPALHASLPNHEETRCRR